MSTEKMDVRIEVVEDGVFVLFPRKMDSFMFPYQEAYQLGSTLETAAGDVSTPLVIDPGAIQAETEQLRINTYKDQYVIILFQWTDRIKLGKEAAIIVARALRAKAQELDLLKNKKVRLVTGKGNLLTKIVNEKAGTTQIIPGRR